MDAKTVNIKESSMEQLLNEVKFRMSAEFEADQRVGIEKLKEIGARLGIAKEGENEAFQKFFTALCPSVPADSIAHCNEFDDLGVENPTGPVRISFTLPPSALPDYLTGARVASAKILEEQRDKEIELMRAPNMAAMEAQDKHIAFLIKRYLGPASAAPGAKSAHSPIRRTADRLAAERAADVANEKASTTEESMEAASARRMAERTKSRADAVAAEEAKTQNP